MAVHFRMVMVLVMVALPACASEQWVAGWKRTFPLSIERNGTATVLVNDRIYVIGGRNGSGSLTSTEFTQIQADGSLDPWQFGPSLNEERSFMDAVVHGDSIYVVGGANGPSDVNLLRTVERARILPDGTLGPWQLEKNAMVVPRRCNKVMATDKALYAFGGYGGVLLDSVESAEWQPDGSLGEWRLEPESLTTPRYINTVKKIGEDFYVIGGHRDDGNSMAEIEWSRPMPDGRLQKWQAATPMNQERWGLAAALLGDDLYAMGGLYGPTYLDSTEHARVGEGGRLGPWQATTPLDQPRATFGTIIYRDTLYVVGGSYPEGYLSSVIYARRNAAGDLGYWAGIGELQKIKAREERERARARKPKLPNEGIVRELLQAKAYTYVQVEDQEYGLVWVAGPKIDSIKTGDRVGYGKGTPLRGFSSRELQRVFPLVILVGSLQMQ